MSDDHEDGPHEDAEYGLLVPFLDTSDSFAHGVEFGMIFEQLKVCREAGEPFRQYVTIANQEQLTLAANRLGWHIETMRPWGDQWFWIEMTPPVET